MAQSYADACDRIMTLCRAQTWIKQAPEDPPATAAQFPFAAIFPGSGGSKLTGGYRVDLHTVNLEIHWAFKDLPRGTGDAKDHVEDLLTMLWGDVTLNGAVATLNGEITYDFGPMSWQGVATLGFVIHIPFKINVAQT